MNWVLMVTGGIVLIGLLIGVYRGAIRIAVSLLASLLTLILVTVLTPYVADAVMKYTPLEDVIQGMVAKAVTDTATSAVADEDGSGLTGTRSGRRSSTSRLTGRAIPPPPARWVCAMSWAPG